jgi:hypothetical protein
MPYRRPLGAGERAAVEKSRCNGTKMDSSSIFAKRAICVAMALNAHQQSQTNE